MTDQPGFGAEARSTVEHVGVGIHTLTAQGYHGDPCASPSLSRSIAHLLCVASPAHARAAHPRLNPQHEEQYEERFDVGTAAHAWLLEGRDPTVVCDYPDWRKKSAQEERDAARAAGRVPLLTYQWENVKAMVDAVLAQIHGLKVHPFPFTEGKAEQALIWEEDGVWCRALCDWLRNDRTKIDDLKTTAGSAHPSAFEKSMFSYGYDLQAAFYSRGVYALTGDMPEFRFVVCETSPPYAISVVTPAESVLDLANAKLNYAIRTWRECLKSDRWPAYPGELAAVSLPSWEEIRWMEKMDREGLTAWGEVAA